MQNLPMTNRQQSVARPTPPLVVHLRELRRTEMKRMEIGLDRIGVGGGGKPESKFGEGGREILGMGPALFRPTERNHRDQLCLNAVCIGCLDVTMIEAYPFMHREEKIS